MRDMNLNCSLEQFLGIMTINVFKNLVNNSVTQPPIKQDAFQITGKICM